MHHIWAPSEQRSKVPFELLDKIDGDSIKLWPRDLPPSGQDVHLDDNARKTIQRRIVLASIRGVCEHPCDQRKINLVSAHIICAVLIEIPGLFDSLAARLVL
jgi:hypothetical protein